MTQVFKSRITGALQSREAQGLSRKVNVLDGGNQARFNLNEQSLINFSSNDYLGLASDSELVEMWQKGLSLYGAGSGASPLVTGFSPAHQRLEENLCHWLGYDRAILFSSGFSANQAVLFSLLQKQDSLIQDKLNHASLMEAGMLAPAQMKRFRHNDVSHLGSLLESTQEALVVTEGVFSMDGDKSPLTEIQHLCQSSQSWLMVDDAHGIGVLGKDGRGSCDQAGIRPEILVVTFGKAFGLSGAAVMCSSQTGDYLTQFARHHVYSTAIPPSQAYALAGAAGMIQNQNWRREKLAELQSEFDLCLSDTEGFVKTETPIKPFICGSTDKAMSMASSLRKAGFWVTAIRPPTVPSGTARLRITLTAKHSKKDVQGLCEVMKQTLK